MKKRRGQVTIFIIIGILIVALGAAVYLFYPDIQTTIGTEAQTPSAYIQNCLQEKMEETVETLSMQGGFLAPELYFLKNDVKIGYLCYTNEYYLTCIIQQPLLKNFIEKEINEEIEEEANECFNSLVESYRGKNYNVNLKKGNTSVEILPNKIVASYDYSLGLTKEVTENYESFKVTLDNNLYELLSIAHSIIEWEATYGDSETTMYMTYYHNLKVEKQKQNDGTTLYILTDRDTNDMFQFASRSVAWPPGY